MNLETMQREGREKVYKDIIYWVMNPSAREAIFTPKEANDVIDQHTANTWKACLATILESGLLEEKPLIKSIAYTKENAEATVHNTLARAVKEFMSNMDKK